MTGVNDQGANVSVVGQDLSVLTDRKVIGNRIKTLRKNQGLSQRELSEKLGISQTMVSNWENGRNNVLLEDVYSICKFFGINIQEFLWG